MIDLNWMQLSDLETAVREILVEYHDDADELAVREIVSTVLEMLSEMKPKS